MMEIGSRIKALREARGWSMYRLAQKSGCCPTSICHYESGETVPQLDKAVAVAQALGTTVEALVGVPEYCSNEAVLQLKKDNLRLRKDLVKAREELQHVCNFLRVEILK